MWRTIQMIEAEHGKSLLNIFEEMRARGKSWKEVAGALGVHHHTVLRWRKQIGFEAGFKRGENKLAEAKKNIQAIESEFDEPLMDIVVVMREQGNTWSTIAGALEIHIHTLLKWRKKYGFCPPNGRDQVHEFQNNVSPIDDLARGHGYADFGEMYRHLRLEEHWTVAQVAKKIGVSRRTVGKWAPEELKGHRVITDKLLKACMRNLKIAWDNRDTPWQDDMYVKAKRSVNTYEGPNIS